MTDKINSYKDLRVFQNAMKAAMKIFELTENFPPEEKYSMTDQLRRSSRCVCANITRAWRKRRFNTCWRKGPQPLAPLLEKTNYTLRLPC